MSNINTIRLSGTTYQIEDSNATKTVELTQAQYDALVDKDPNTYYIITDAEAGDLTNYYTKTETDTLLSGKQATLVSGTNIKTINNESILGSGNIDIQGGGKAIEAGRGISITTGETADTVSFNLPISAGTGSNSIQEGEKTSATNYYAHAEGGYTKALGDSSHSEGRSTVASGISTHAEGYFSQANGNYSHAEGYSTSANSNYSHAEGNATIAGGERSHAEGSSSQAQGYISHAEGAYTVASGGRSHAEGNYTNAVGHYSHSEGNYTNASNQSEHASGQYNISTKASTTFGHSGNTLFSVGNGTRSNERHNAFEVKQNGDIWVNDGTNDVRLQDTILALGGLKLRSISQADYDALAVKDPMTLYIIND